MRVDSVTRPQAAQRLHQAMRECLELTQRVDATHAALSSSKEHARKVRGAGSSGGWAGGTRCGHSGHLWVGSRPARFKGGWQWEARRCQGLPPLAARPATRLQVLNQGRGRYEAQSMQDDLLMGGMGSFGPGLI